MLFSMLVFFAIILLVPVFWAFKHSKVKWEGLFMLILPMLFFIIAVYNIDPADRYSKGHGGMEAMVDATTVLTMMPFMLLLEQLLIMVGYFIKPQRLRYLYFFTIPALGIIPFVHYYRPVMNMLFHH